MAKSIFAVFFPTMGVEMPSCFVAYLCFVMDALRIGGPPWDTIRWTDWEGTVLWACFPLAGSCTCYNCWLHRALTWIKRVILHWWMTCWLHVTHHSSSHPYFLFTLFVSLFLSLTLYCCLALFFFMMYGRATHPPPSTHPWIKCHGLTSCSFQGLEKTTSKIVSLTNVFYLSTLNNVAVKHVRRVVSYIQSHLVAWDYKAALWTWHSVFAAPNHSR